MAVFEWSQSW